MNRISFILEVDSGHFLKPIISY